MSKKQTLVDDQTSLPLAARKIRNAKGQKIR